MYVCTLCTYTRQDLPALHPSNQSATCSFTSPPAYVHIWWWWCKVQTVTLFIIWYFNIFIYIYFSGTTELFSMHWWGRGGRGGRGWVWWEKGAHSALNKMGGKGRGKSRWMSTVSQQNPDLSCATKSRESREGDIIPRSYFMIYARLFIFCIESYRMVQG